MLPTYREGEVVLVSMFRKFNVGDVVIVVLNKREMIKRITRMERGRVFVEGDNAGASTDSRQLGWVMDDHILGKVVFPRRKKSK